MKTGKMLQQLKYTPLPLGAVKPRGWLKRQLQIQADGLSGHIDEIWEDLGPNNKWLGGKKDGWERGPYYADGLVPLAYLLEDEKLKKKAQQWVEAFINGQDETGWIGPVKGERDIDPEYDPWPIFVVFKVLTQYHEATGDERVIPVMTNFCRYLAGRLDEAPLDSWARFRWADFVFSIHWLFDRTGEEWLLKLAEKVAEQGYNWQKHFAQFPYKKKQPIKMETHVVNNAMGIKTPAVWYRQSGSEQDRQAVYLALENLDKFHGQVTGVFTGDEHFSGKNPSQGTELCAVVEYMFSLEHMISILGDASFGDRLEMITYNALPATFTPDMWAHQYDQQANQVICNVAERDWTNGPDANIFGLEPNFGCCAANMHQGWPKFVSSLWMQAPDEGLAAVAYGPSKVTTSVGGQEVTLTEETNYPFAEEITFRVEASLPVSFPLILRIPNWANGATVKLPDGEVASPEPGGFFQVRREWKNGDEVKLTLPMQVVAERRYRGAVSILRGPLVYSLRVGEQWKLLAGRPPHGDWEIYPTTPWNYGLVVDTANPGRSVRVEKKAVGNCPFSPDEAPLEIKIKGRLVPEWKMEDNSAGQIPLSPVRSREPLEELTLIPYGCTNLRVTEFPLLEESGKYNVGED